MKLAERSSRRHGPTAPELLGPTSETVAVFDIRRDVRDQDWTRLRAALKGQVEGPGMLSGVDAEAVQLIVLGQENKLDFKLELISKVGVIEINTQLRRPTSYSNTAALFAHWLVIDPQARAQVLEKIQREGWQEKFWETLRQSKQTSLADAAVSLCLLLSFPDQREQIKQKCNLEKLKNALLRSVQEGGTEILEFDAALLLALLFPGESKDLINADWVRSIHSENSFLALGRLASAYVLSADEVDIDGQGKIQIKNRYSGLPPASQLPTRSLV